jgi:hypothetical protein
LFLEAQQQTQPDTPLAPPKSSSLTERAGRSFTFTPLDLFWGLRPWRYNVVVSCLIPETTFWKPYGRGTFIAV